MSLNSEIHHCHFHHCHFWLSSLPSLTLIIAIFLPKFNLVAKTRSLMFLNLLRKLKPTINFGNNINNKFCYWYCCPTLDIENFGEIQNEHKLQAELRKNQQQVAMEKKIISRLTHLDITSPTWKTILLGCFVLLAILNFKSELVFFELTAKIEVKKRSHEFIETV